MAIASWTTLQCIVIVYTGFIGRSSHCPVWCLPCVPSYWVSWLLNVREESRQSTTNHDVFCSTITVWTNRGDSLSPWLMSLERRCCWVLTVGIEITAVETGRHPKDHVIYYVEKNWNGHIPFPCGRKNAINVLVFLFFLFHVVTWYQAGSSGGAADEENFREPCAEESQRDASHHHGGRRSRHGRLQSSSTCSQQRTFEKAVILLMMGKSFW